MVSLWLRWSWRDLQARWLSVVTIALVIAIGTGVYAGLTSTSTWRRESNDASFAALRMYDLRVQLGPTSFVPEGGLAAVAEGVAPGELAQATERLVLPTQVDASTGSESILVPGRLVGVPVGGDIVNDSDVTAGRDLGRADDGAPVGLIEHHFAEYYDLPTRRAVGLAGGESIDIVGRFLSPEYFIVTGERGGFLAESNYAVVLVPLATAQNLTGNDGRVNDLVLTLRPGTDRDAFEAELERSLAAELPDVSATVMTRDEERAYQVLYDDIASDERFWIVVSLLVLSAAFVAAFNLIGRMVEAQRREIGVGMALGVTSGRLAVRPMLVGLQVAVLGALMGIGVGLLVGSAMSTLLIDLLPLPVWKTPFQVGPFARAATIGIALPIVAAIVPVSRAVRVDPVEAMKPIHLVVRGSHVPAVLGRVALPGRALIRMPVRDLVRNPRRTLLTVIGVGAAISALVGVSGLLDTFLYVVDRGEAEIERSEPDRVDVNLEEFVTLDSELVAGIAAAPEVGEIQPAVVLPTTLTGPGGSLDTMTTVLDLAGPIWHPSVPVEAASPDTGGPLRVYLAEKAMDDLDVDVGDRLTLQHPERTDVGFTVRDTEVVVAGEHPNPLRFLVYIDESAAPAFGLEAAANLLFLRPAVGVSTDEVERAIFGRPGVSSAQAASRAIDEFERVLEHFVGLLRITQVAVLALASMIAFNASRITVDERARDHATMFAFGVPVRTVWAEITVESILIGAFGALIGIGGGALMTTWMVEWLLPETAPDIGLTTHISGGTILGALVVGIVAVGVAPLLTLRRLVRMDLPSTLRLVE